MLIQVMQRLLQNISKDVQGKLTRTSSKLIYFGSVLSAVLAAILGYPISETCCIKYDTYF